MKKIILFISLLNIVTESSLLSQINIERKNIGCNNNRCVIGYNTPYYQFNCDSILVNKSREVILTETFEYIKYYQKSIDTIFTNGNIEIRALSLSSFADNFECLNYRFNGMAIKINFIVDGEHIKLISSVQHGANFKDMDDFVYISFNTFISNIIDSYKKYITYIPKKLTINKSDSTQIKKEIGYFKIKKLILTQKNKIKTDSLNTYLTAIDTIIIPITKIINNYNGTTLVGYTFYKYSYNITFNFSDNFYNIKLDSIKCISATIIGNMGKEYYNSMDDLIEHYFPSGNKTVHKTMFINDKSTIQIKAPLIEANESNNKEEAILELNKKLNEKTNLIITKLYNN